MWLKINQLGKSLTLSPTMAYKGSYSWDPYEVEILLKVRYLDSLMSILIWHFHGQRKWKPVFRSRLVQAFYIIVNIAKIIRFLLVGISTIFYDEFNVHLKKWTHPKVRLKEENTNLAVLFLKKCSLWVFLTTQCRGVGPNFIHVMSSIDRNHEQLGLFVNISSLVH